MALFVDVRVCNRSAKWVRKLELRLERATTFYRASTLDVETMESPASRVPERTERKIVAGRTVRRARRGWRGIAPRSQDERTWTVDVPPGLATVGTGRSCCARAVPFDVCPNMSTIASGWITRRSTTTEPSTSRMHLSAIYTTLHHEHHRPTVPFPYPPPRASR